MGLGMARRLLSSGYPVAVYNRSRAKADALVAEGAQVGATPREAAANADIVFSMVADDAASRALWQGADGVLAALKQGALCIECSTLSVDWAKEFHAAVVGKGGTALDCPVTGSKNEAANGGLRFLVGGEPAVIEQARPILSVLGTDVIHMGPAGSGCLIKLLNNSLLGVHISAYAQVLAVIEASSLNKEKALGLVLNGAAASPIVKTVAPRMAARDYTPNFALGLIVKDLKYVLAEAERLGGQLTVAKTALAAFETAAKANLGEKDVAAIAETIRFSK